VFEHPSRLGADPRRPGSSLSQPADRFPRTVTTSESDLFFDVAPSAEIGAIVSIEVFSLAQASPR
jgi:hypothetical protein